MRKSSICGNSMEFDLSRSLIQSGAARSRVWQAEKLEKEPSLLGIPVCEREDCQEG